MDSSAKGLHFRGIPLLADITSGNKGKQNVSVVCALVMPTIDLFMHVFLSSR